MSGPDAPHRGPDDGPEDGPAGGPPQPGPGNVRPSRPGPLVVVGAIAAVLGWAVRPLSFRLDVAEPVISLANVLVIWAIAAATAALAVGTWRALQRPARDAPRDPGRGPGPTRPRLEPHQAVNRLMLGKAAALAGAVVLGGYAGFAIAHLGIPATDLATQRLQRAAFCSLGGIGILVAGLLLERACRVREERR